MKLSCWSIADDSDAKRRIGRGVKLGLDLSPDGEVSEDHATIHRSSGQSTIVDNESTNGTWLVRGNDRFSLRPNVPETLQHGDILQMGATTLIFIRDNFKDHDEAMAATRREVGLRNILSVYMPPRGDIERTI